MNLFNQQWPLNWASPLYAIDQLIALFTMGTFTILGLAKLMEGAPAVQSPSIETASPAAAPHSLTHQID